MSGRALSRRVTLKNRMILKEVKSQIIQKQIGKHRKFYFTWSGGNQTQRKLSFDNLAIIDIMIIKMDFEVCNRCIYAPAFSMKKIR